MNAALSGPSQGEFRWSLTIGADRPEGGDLARVVQFNAAHVAARGGGRLQIWVENAADEDDSLLESVGFEPYRDLWQLRCPLPAAPTDLAVRGFTPDDEDDFLEVNNKAFEWHPEQGHMTTNDLRERTNEPWFRPDGFLLHHREGRLAAFCWTKVHDDTMPPLGEIYAIAVHPDFVGGGLGTEMTLAGLDWLAARGLENAMLYVESDNAAANAVYARIGFVHHSTNRAYQALIADGS